MMDHLFDFGKCKYCGLSLFKIVNKMKREEVWPCKGKKFKEASKVISEKYYPCLSEEEYDIKLIIQ